jgi:hypothetical protein
LTSSSVRFSVVCPALNNQARLLPRLILLIKPHKPNNIPLRFIQGRGHCYCSVLECSVGSWWGCGAKDNLLWQIHSSVLPNLCLGDAHLKSCLGVHLEKSVERS